MTDPEIHAVLTAAASNVELFDDRTIGFIEDLACRYDVEGGITELSTRQENWLRAVRAELRRRGVRVEDEA